MMDIKFKEAQARLQRAQISHAKLSSQVDSARAEYRDAMAESKNKFGVDSVAELIRMRDEMNGKNEASLVAFNASMTVFEAALQQTQSALSAPVVPATPAP